jgi:hypothetical protein
LVALHCFDEAVPRWETADIPEAVSVFGRTDIVPSSGEMTQPQVISATMLRTKTRDILEKARFEGGHFIVETFGKPMVAIVGVEEYWELVNHLGSSEHGRAIHRESQARDHPQKANR